MYQVRYSLDFSCVCPEISYVLWVLNYPNGSLSNLAGLFLRWLIGTLASHIGKYAISACIFPKN